MKANSISKINGGMIYWDRYNTLLSVVKEFNDVNNLFLLVLLFFFSFLWSISIKIIYHKKIFIVIV